MDSAPVRVTSLVGSPNHRLSGTRISDVLYRIFFFPIRARIVFGPRTRTIEEKNRGIYVSREPALPASYPGSGRHFSRARDSSPFGEVIELEVAGLVTSCTVVCTRPECALDNSVHTCEKYSDSGEHVVHWSA